MEAADKPSVPGAEAPVASGRLISIQYLRAGAALTVVLLHSINHFPRPPGVPRPEFALAGIDLFFVISGFVMTITTARKRYTFSEFITRRIVRIVPIYWFYTFLTAALIVLMPAAFKSSIFSFSNLALSLAFFPHVNPGSGTIDPMMKIGWTLNYEMFFYVLFALAVALRPAIRSLLISACFAALWILNSKLSPSPAPIEFWGKLIVFEFSLGMLVAHVFLSGMLRRVPIPLALAAIAGGCATLGWFALSGLPVPRVYCLGLPGALIVAGLVAVEERGSLGLWRLARFLGDASYSVYLSHLFALVVLRKAWMMLGLPDAGALWMLSFVAIGLALGSSTGAISYLLVEKPSLAVLQRRFVYRR